MRSLAYAFFKGDSSTLWVDVLPNLSTTMQFSYEDVDPEAKYADVVITCSQFDIDMKNRMAYALLVAKHLVVQGLTVSGSKRSSPFHPYKCGADSEWATSTALPDGRRLGEKAKRHPE